MEWERLEISSRKLEIPMEHVLQRWAGFRKGRGTRDQIANILCIIEKESSSKTVTSALLNMPKPLTVWTTTNCGKLFKRWECQTISPASWEICVQIKKPQIELDWFQVGKGEHQGCILSPCLFNFYSEYIMWNAGLDEAQAGIKIAGRNINNLRYADDTTLMADSEEELKSLLMKVKEERERAGLKLNIQKTKIMASSLITSWQVDREIMEAVTDFIFLGSKNHCWWWLQPWN